MKQPLAGLRRAFSCLMLAVPLLLAGCLRGEPASQEDFVGKWRSSRLSAPIQMHQNGEWEILKDDGTVWQYGVWQFKNNSILWSYKADGRLGHDANAVLSVTPKEFRLRERDGSVTTFVRLF